MLVLLILELIQSIIVSLFSGFNIPSIPQTVHDLIADLFQLFSDVLPLINAYLPLSYMFTLFGIALSVELAIRGYHLMMWILKKIPIINIK